MIAIDTHLMHLRHLYRTGGPNRAPESTVTPQPLMGKPVKFVIADEVNKYPTAPMSPRPRNPFPPPVRTDPGPLYQPPSATPPGIATR